VAAPVEPGIAQGMPGVTPDPGTASAGAAVSSVPAGPPSGIALILPSKAAGFKAPAEAARKGFMAARGISVDKPVVTVLETDGSAAGAVAAYRQALAANVAVVVGPLTKTEAAAVQNEPIRVPTLMLNTPDGTLNPVHGLYALSLSVELEAKAAAEAVFRPEASTAVVITMPAPLSKRSGAAFSDAWTKLGGTVKDTIEYSGNPVKIKRAVERARSEVVFLATDADRARVIRPFLGRNQTIIATSQVYAMPRPEGPAALAGHDELLKINDLNGLRFIDMPWLHQPDHTAVMVYPHPNPPLSADQERLYALGIDAFRVAEQLAKKRDTFDLDGVIGKLSVHQGLIGRAPIEAEYRDGAPVTLSDAVLAHGDAGGDGTPAGAAR
jgi:hypothetical protein